MYPNSSDTTETEVLAPETLRIRILWMWIMGEEGQQLAQSGSSLERVPHRESFEHWE